MNNKTNNDFENYEFEDNEEQIRPPDSVIREQLISNTPMYNINNVNDYNDYNYDEALNKAIYESFNQYNNQDNNQDLQKILKESIEEYETMKSIYQSYEETLLNKHLQEKNRRLDIFSNFIKELHKLKKIDNNVNTNNVVDIIEKIIESYCEQEIEIYEVDEELYNKIFKYIKSIRNTENIKNILEKIILKSN